MAIYELHNDKLKIQVDTFGAELHSILGTESNQEYLWHGDATYWGRRSPILFPLVGSLRNKQYQYDGKTYAMNQHGFARDMEFTMAEQTSTSISFTLASTEDTYEKYPFHFLLTVTYTLDGNSLKVTWNVKNTDSKTMHFSIGGHPAFLCPLKSTDKQTDCFLHFDCNELTVTNINESGLALPDKHKIPLEDGCLSISEHLFDDDALVVEHHQTHEVSLLNPEKQPYLTVSFDAPLFGVWSPAMKQAPFVCIEPWYGRCDSSEFTGELKDREWGNTLQADDTFERSYIIKIHE